MNPIIKYPDIAFGYIKQQHWQLSLSRWKGNIISTRIAKITSLETFYIILSTFILRLVRNLYQVTFKIIFPIPMVTIWSAAEQAETS